LQSAAGVLGVRVLVLRLAIESLQKDVAAAFTTIAGTNLWSKSRRFAVRSGPSTATSISTGFY